MKQVEAVRMVHFKPTVPADYASDTQKDQTFYEDMLELAMKKASEEYKSFMEDWYCMFSRIMGQICPVMEQ